MKYAMHVNNPCHWDAHHGGLQSSLNIGSAQVRLAVTCRAAALMGGAAAGPAQQLRLTRP